MVSLASLTYDLFHTLKQTPGHKGKEFLLKVAAVIVPVLLMVAAYAIDTDDPDVDNVVLNNRFVFIRFYFV
jgi:hypothetical protein